DEGERKHTVAEHEPSEAIWQIVRRSGSAAPAPVSASPASPADSTDLSQDRSPGPSSATARTRPGPEWPPRLPSPGRHTAPATDPSVTLQPGRSALLRVRGFHPAPRAGRRG